MKMITTLIPSPEDIRDYKYEFIELSEENLPKTLDMRNEILAVRNQGADGACVAFTASCMKEVQERRDIDFNEYMSPQFIYLNRQNRNTEGMYPRDLMRILSTIGSIPEKMMPYQKSTKITKEMLKNASNHRISGYASISTIDGLKSALVKNGPALLGIPVYHYGKHLWYERTGDRLRGGHAVAVVGWDETGFIIRNSWGASWNGDGHTHFPFEHWGMQWETWTSIDADSVKEIVNNKPKKKKLTPREKRRMRQLAARKAAEKARIAQMERIKKLIEEIRKRKPRVVVVNTRRRRRRPIVRRRRPNVAQERMKRARRRRRRTQP